MQFTAQPGDTFRIDNDGAATVATFDELGDAGEFVYASHVRILNPRESTDIHQATHYYLIGGAPVYVGLMNDNFCELLEKVCAITNGMDIANDCFECAFQAWSGPFEDADRGVA